VRSILLAIFVLALPFSTVQSTSETTELTPNCGGPFQLCGYQEKDSKIQRIPMQFEIAQPFHDGLAGVRVNGLQGYINPLGKVVIAPRFQTAGPFRGGYAEVRIKGASGIIDRTGRLVVPARFNRITPFHNGTFIATPLQKDQSYSVDSRAELSGFTGSIDYELSSDAGLYHIKRGWLTSKNLKFSFFDAPERGMIWARSENEQEEEVWGLLKSNGTWKVSPRYNHVQMLVETHAIVHSMPDHKLPSTERQESVLWGAVDRNGDLIVPMKFGHLSYWRGGYGRASAGKPFNADGTLSKEKEAIVRSDGSLLGGRYFDEIDIPEDGKLPRVRVGNIWRSIQPDGNLIHDQLEGEPLLECAGGLAIIRRGDMAEFRRSIDGGPIGRFDKGYFSQRDCPGPFSAKRGRKWFIIMADGKVLGGEKGFDNSYSFTGTHTAVEVDGKWGIIDRSGEFSVNPTFAKLRPDRNATFAVGERDDIYWIDASGNRVAKPLPDKVEPSKALTCKGGLQFFEQAGLWGFRDEAGKTIIAPEFRALSCFSQGVSWTASSGQDAWCPIGPDGSRRTEIACREGYYPMFITHHSPEKFNIDPYESSVLWMRAWLDYNAGKRDNPPKWIPDSMGRGSSSGMEGGPYGPERKTPSDKRLLVTGFIGLLLALFRALQAELRLG
jgi:WG containing repeat